MDGTRFDAEQGAEPEVVSDAELCADDRNETAERGEPPYIPDPRVLWGSEAARAMLVVLTRRLGPDFAREVSNELASRTLAYQSGCPDDQRDGETMQALICDGFWDRLFELPEPGRGQ